jgi:hypothetical protein
MGRVARQIKLIHTLNTDMSMRRFITLTENLGSSNSEFLLEAQNYDEMFKAILKIDTNLRQLVPDANVSPFNLMIYKELSAAKKILKKSERVIWYLRWMRWSLTSLMTREWSFAARDPNLPQTIEPCKELGLLYNRYTGELKKTWGERLEAIVTTNPDNFLNRCEHFFSLPIAGIQDYVFGNKNPGIITRDFQTMEREWQADQRSMIEHKDESVLLSFPSGMMWVDLRRPNCRIEGDAMGHCGNTAGSKHDDTVLSLRKIIEKGDRKYWQPYLTFILHGDGYLGEMKGRGNDKPAERYHPYILALLEAKNSNGWIIKGIRGGGYMPENNFSVNDLTEDEQNALFEKRPELASVKWAYERFGLVDHVKESIVDELVNETGHNVSGPWDEDYLVLEKMANWEDFVDSYGDDKAQYYAKYLTGDDYLENDYNHDISDVERFLDNLPSKTVAAIGQYLKTTYNISEDEDFDEEYGDEFDPTNTTHIAKILRNEDDEIYGEILSSLETGERDGAEKEMQEAMEQAFRDADLDFSEVVFDNETGQFEYDTPVLIRISGKKAVELLASPDDISNIAYEGWMEGKKIKLEEPQYGFQDYDEESAIDNFFESNHQFDFRPQFLKNIQEMSDEQKRSELTILLQVTNAHFYGNRFISSELVAKMPESEVNKNLYKYREMFRNNKRNDPSKWPPELVALLKPSKEIESPEKNEPLSQ